MNPFSESKLLSSVANQSRLPNRGDVWEKEIADQFGRDMATFQVPCPQELSSSRELVQRVDSWVKQTSRLEPIALALLAQQQGFRFAPLAWADKTFWLLEDASARGWGKVLWGEQPERPELVVEVPHPCFDRGTPELGLRLFQASGAGTLILAGSHRHNRPEPSPEQPSYRISDPAHSSSTFFQAAHQGLLEEQPRVILQVHGFSPRAEEPWQIVLSDGVDNQQRAELLRELGQQFSHQNFQVFVHDFATKRLTARSNLQKQTMVEAGQVGANGPCRFIHLEVCPDLRLGREREALTDQACQAITRWSAQVLGRSQ